MRTEDYLTLKERLIEAGYSKEISWSEAVGPPPDSLTFFSEYAWVVINSGMKNQVAQKIWKSITDALWFGARVLSVYGHLGKASAIQHVWENQQRLFEDYLACPDSDKLSWIQTLPWIGPITKYHLAKNLGMDACKPDRHLVRIASKYQLTPEKLCSFLAQETGNRIGTVDYVLWRAANLGWI